MSDPLAYRLYLLGSFRLERAGRTIRLPTHKIESLLAYLALYPAAHTRDKLAALLWGDTTDTQARHSLRTALAALRKALGADSLLADRETIQLHPALPLWVDAREFQSTLDLYHGDLLADYDDEWILPEREHYRGLYHTLLLQLAQEARSRSQYAQAIAHAQKILASDPTHEQAHQQLIFCTAALGDRIGALKQFDECAKKLRDELGVEPSPETLALRDQIMQALTGGPVSEVVLTNLPIPLTSFVGRAQEMVELKRLLTGTDLTGTLRENLSGLLQLVTLTGAGGSGKTRLALQVGRDIAAQRLYRHGVWWVALAALNDPALVTLLASLDCLRLDDLLDAGRYCFHRTSKNIFLI
jgi:DNA-binding SARP family transcriptional activator